MLRTIRSKMLFVFTASLVSALALAAFHGWSLSTLKNRFVMSERIEDLQNDILEVRRFEKNYLLYHDGASLTEGLNYLDQVERLAASLSGDTAAVLGEAAYRAFAEDLAAYRSALSRLPAEGVPAASETELVRSRGKALTDFATKLLAAKRQRIHEAIESTLALPFAFVAIFVAVTIAVGALVIQRVLKPLALLKETTQRVGHGDFSPVALRPGLTDEISGLMGAFNLMALELAANQEDLLQARKMAALGTFTAGVAHELNNPINNISLTAEALLEDYDDRLDDEGRELLHDVMGQAERAADIVRNLLDFSRTERAAFTRLSLAEVVNSTVSLLKNQLAASGVSLSLSLPPGLPPVRGNLRNLQQVFLNILLNAVQAMPQGGEIRVAAAAEDGGCVKVEVADTGPGIPEEVQEHIFEPFFTTKDAGKGTGLGLAVAYSFIRRHGGRLEVKSAPGAGATFTVRLPAEGGPCPEPAMEPEAAP